MSIKAMTIRDELQAANALIAPLKSEVANQDTEGAISTVDQLRAHTAAAKQSAEDPVWALASTLPGIGSNFAVVAEVARSADDVANLGLAPLAKVFDSLDWNALVPSGTTTDLGPLVTASPSVTSAAHAVRASSERLDEIDPSGLWPQIAEPLVEARDRLREVTGALDASADASRLLPSMMGVETPRNYLLMVQNNAESRASGGIPGALAVLELQNGKFSLGAQSSAGEIGTMSPVIALDEVQQQIYSRRLGKFMQDVNLTPDFPTAARTAAAMWERKTGQHLDGVVSVDPVALSYILKATGPVRVSGPELSQVASLGLPTELNGRNVVPTLLSEVYAKIEEPRLQDAYFAGVAHEIFDALSREQTDPKGLITGISRGVTERRISLWSASESEQSIIGTYPLSGSIAGPSVPAAQFGVYFNDGTGAKMDYYVKRTVQLIRECPADGYEQTTVRITSTNTAPADAATSLPGYVTGAGMFGVPPGSVQTNIVAYGPVQATVETAHSDGQRTEFAPYFHSNRPVGVLAVRLAPGESKTVEFTFGKIVQHTKPNLVVTPTVQDVKDMTLPMENEVCG
ncbi:MULTISPECIES: DUF4012 domain-containing protein [unclassified Arthrobacter]|uniref:DUF4012 domain-containing protein n=1 Tax=unclassified Arthrobacter TaxID=235627 RepID=UPI001F0DA8DE|nr:MULTISPECIES: DUF4012 domain-containing protein [unclassified Arthrobacter]